MENKQLPSKKLLSIKEEKLIREVDSLVGEPHLSNKQLILDFEIFQKKPTKREASQKVLVSIKPRMPTIRTLYIAEKSRFNAKKNSEKSGSRLAIGDHSSFTTNVSEYNSNSQKSSECKTEQGTETSNSKLEQYSSINEHLDTSTVVSKCFQFKTQVPNTPQRSIEKCYIYTQPKLIMNLPKVNAKNDKSKGSSHKVDIATLIVTNTSSEDSALPSTSTLQKINRRIDCLERKIMKQEIMFRAIDPNVPISSSEDESKNNVIRTASGIGRPCCSYIEQYSHIPETSAFQRYAHQTAPLSPSKAATLEKEHNSEQYGRDLQYGRDFTTYDGITARGRRQCASVPCKRDDVPKMAAERVHKIRHKLNPVRDYRLMDTVHYLAQGEFAPRDDGIKLTPSREAVLSDIIWEDVCRTHWPNTRLGRRIAHPERCSTRCELQRLIDSLLRERVAHVERRRRRHYRIVKLNHRHESCRPVGKTGDIIVASHKNKQPNDDRRILLNDVHTTSAVMTDRRREEQNLRNGHKSHDRLILPDFRRKNASRLEDCIPGPSHAFSRQRTNREATCCYHTSSPIKLEQNTVSSEKTNSNIYNRTQELTSGSSSTYKPYHKTPRLVVKKDASRRKYQSKEEPDLEHYILLPTLVVRTPSNVKRQKKFNELYHRILNVHLNKAENSTLEDEISEQTTNENHNMKDIGFNINITLSRSSEQFNTK
ncbi:uncharacterized protein LOC131846356 [Achroia grisella]|uniref:uncharacterized protein LOC131846356 n=1 Tax=Achroia grisella TaxID=688607 RepID=UPI0027D24284|nr:uncharacterized protein LOC131846356 [Achroia grisella]